MTVLASVHSLPNGYLSVQTVFDQAVVAQFREAPGCRFIRGDVKAWVGPEEAVQPVLDRLQRAGVIVIADYRKAEPSIELPAFRVDSLHNYQQDGVKAMLLSLKRLRASLNADDMGLGKTVQALRAADAILPVGGRALILCPALMTLTWMREAKRWLGVDLVRLGVDTAAGRAADEQWRTSGGFAIMTCDGFASAQASYNDRMVGKAIAAFCDALVCLTDPGRGFTKVKTRLAKAERYADQAVGLLAPVDLLVLDELHYYANPSSKRSKAVKKFLDGHRVRPYVIGLTGTPIPVRVKDLWNPLELLAPGRFGHKSGFSSFEARYADGQFVEIKGLDRAVWQADGASNLEELGSRLRNSGLMVRRVKGEVADELPARQRILTYVELPDRQRRALASAYVAMSDGTSVGRALSAVEEHKIDAAIELTRSLQQQGRRVLLFTVRRATAKRLGEALNAPYVTGEDTPDSRRDVLADADVGVATIYSVTTGITLTNFDTVVFVGIDWVPSTLLQAEARIHRIGQTRDVVFYYLIGAQTIDETIAGKVIERLDAFTTVIGSNESESGLALTLRGGKTNEELLDDILSDVMRMAA